jgi:hypothetical protein
VKSTQPITQARDNKHTDILQVAPGAVANLPETPQSRLKMPVCTQWVYNMSHVTCPRSSTDIDAGTHTDTFPSHARPLLGVAEHLTRQTTKLERWNYFQDKETARLMQREHSQTDARCPGHWGQGAVNVTASVSEVQGQGTGPRVSNYVHHCKVQHRVCWKLPSHRATPHQGSVARSRVTAESWSKLLEENGREGKGMERNGKERKGKSQVT